MAKLRLTVFLDSEADPEVYRSLVALPPRVRAQRLKALALVGAMALMGQPGFSSLDGEKREGRREVARRLLASVEREDS
ncbi:MAG: hypothetical protein N3A55_10795 [Methylohalobius sp.]|nr:hypothetical protein [Methylohalobius sp.]